MSSPPQPSFDVYQWIWTAANRVELKLKHEALPHVTSSLIMLKQPSSTALQLVCELPLTSPVFVPSVECTHYYMPYLKSNIQKAIRRKHTEAAMATAYQMLQQDPNELLRRLPIIATEDAWWTTDVNGIVWLMCWYAKTKMLYQSQVSFVLRTVRRLCELSTAFDFRELKTEHYFYDWSSVNVLSPWSLALLVRYHYGGTKGDMALVWYTWKKQGWKEEKEVDDVQQRPLSHLDDDVQRCPLSHPDEIQPIPFLASHMLLEAIDFHCSDVVKRLQTQGNWPASVLKKWIWDFRSSVNVRKCWTLSLPKIPAWESILPHLDEWSRYYWKHSVQQPNAKKQSVVPWVTSSSSVINPKLVYMQQTSQSKKLPDGLGDAKHRPDGLGDAKHRPDKRQRKLTDFFK